MARCYAPPPPLRTEAYCFTASSCLLRMRGIWATLVEPYHPVLAKRDEAYPLTKEL